MKNINLRDVISSSKTKVLDSKSSPMIREDYELKDGTKIMVTTPWDSTDEKSKLRLELQQIRFEIKNIREEVAHLLEQLKDYRTRKDLLIEEKDKLKLLLEDSKKK